MSRKAPMPVVKSRVKAPPSPMPAVVKRQYKYLLIQLDNDIKVSLDMMAAGHKIDDGVAAQILSIVVEQINQEASNGWKLYSWALHPVPHIFLEKELK